MAPRPDQESEVMEPGPMVRGLRRGFGRLAFHLWVGRRGVRYNRLVYGIQRRGIYLVPPDPGDLLWICDQFQTEVVSQMFGYGSQGWLSFPYILRQKTLVVSVIREVKRQRRIGFVVMYPPAGFNFWEFGYAIPDPADRNAFNALNTTDAMLHYIFEHIRVPMIGWRTRDDNRAATAVVKRLGYEPGETFTTDGHDYTLYRLDQAGWARRRAKLDEGERRHPSGLPDTFVVLPPPFEPLPVKE